MDDSQKGFLEQFPAAHLLKHAQVQPTRRTERRVEFHGTTVQCRVQHQEGIVTHYSLVIVDHHEATEYIFMFDTGLKTVLQELFNSLPPVGSRISEEAGPDAA